MVPTFVFIDPFGVKGCSLKAIIEILSKPASEVFMLFDVDGVNRLLHDVNMMKAVFGEEGYTEAVKIAALDDSRVKYDKIRALHQQVIQNTGKCRYYLPFRIQATSRQGLDLPHLLVPIPISQHRTNWWNPLAA
jgi:three-Cys-motif partner protein